MYYERYKTEEEIACEVIRGEWGDGEERRSELKAEGYDPERIERLIRKILGT
ncbi:MAG: hypothetical protein NC120_07165 [Ruminococcus sp.]|nr:hypothetical protein [Ruminococcus sp.]